MWESGRRGTNHVKGDSMNGIIGLLIFLADIWAIIKIVQSKVATGTKVLWVLLVLVLPVVGLIIWYLMGPKK